MKTKTPRMPGPLVATEWTSKSSQINYYPHKFRWQPAQRHTWCECGRWEGFLGHHPIRAEHKAWWEQHVKESENEEGR